MWLSAARLRGQLCCPAAGHRVVLSSSGGFELPGRRQEALAKGRGRLPAVLRTTAAETAHDQGAARIQHQKALMRLDSHSETLICVVRVTQAERTCSSCGCTFSRASCPTSRETTFWRNSNWTKFVLFVSLSRPMCLLSLRMTHWSLKM